MVILECSGRFELLGPNLGCLLVSGEGVGWERGEVGRLEVRSVIELFIIIQREVSFGITDLLIIKCPISVSLLGDF